MLNSTNKSSTKHSSSINSKSKTSFSPTNFLKDFGISSTTNLSTSDGLLLEDSAVDLHLSKWLEMTDNQLSTLINHTSFIKHISWKWWNRLLSFDEFLLHLQSKSNLKLTHHMNSTSNILLNPSKLDDSKVKRYFFEKKINKSPTSVKTLKPASYNSNTKYYNSQNISPFSRSNNKLANTNLHASRSSIKTKISAGSQNCLKALNMSKFSEAKNCESQAKWLELLQPSKGI